jgi:DNA-binding beta-propeller fold protein YncE
MISSQAHMRLALMGAAVAVATLVSGCGDNYRPVITPVSSNGPAPEISSYVVAVSTTGTNSSGEVSIIDYSGDSIMAEASLGIGPTAFTIDESGSTGYTLNSDGTLSNFSISTSLQTKGVSTSTVSQTAQIVNLFAPSSGLWTTDLSGNVVDLFSGSPVSFKLDIPVATASSTATMPMWIAGSPTSSGQREYVISQNVADIAPMTCNLTPTSVTANGVATPILISTDTTQTPVTVGKCPVFAVVSSDQKRVFVLNRGSDTVTVIDNTTGALDNVCPGGCKNLSGQTYYSHPTLPLSTTAVTSTGITPINGTSGMTAKAGPVYAVYNAATSQLIVSNYDGGTVSIIDVSLDEYGNDSTTFGTTYTVGVGNTTTPNPASVAVLYDGSKAYTANQGDDSNTGNGTVSVVNLTSHTLEKTITVVGHPRTVAATQNSGYSKVYVASPDSPYITVIESTPTETDVIDTAVRVLGTAVVDLRVTTENGSSGTLSSYSSRVPGYGQPCNLPGSAYLVSLTACQTY